MWAFRLITALETSFIDEIGQLLGHELFDLGDSFVETVLGNAGDVKVERRVLHVDVSHDNTTFVKTTLLTCAVASALFG